MKFPPYMARAPTIFFYNPQPKRPGTKTKNKYFER